MTIQSQHVLVCRTDNIGDVILTLPMVSYLKKQFPHIRISFLCRTYAAPVVRYCKDIDTVFESEIIQDNAVAFFQEQKFDTVIFAQPNKHFSWAAFRAGIRYRIGNAHQEFHEMLLCNKRVFFSKRQSSLHEAQINFAFLQPFGISTHASLKDIPSLYHFDIPEDLDLKNMLAGDQFNLILHTKSNGNGREWPIEHYVRLATMLTGTQVKIWLTGSEEEGKWIRQHAPEFNTMAHVKNICGQLSLEKLIALIHQSNGLIASGTGPLHISSALGKNTLGLFTPTRNMHPGRWAALGKHAQNLSLEESCAPHCKKIKNRSCGCMSGISPEAVLSVVEQWLTSWQEAHISPSQTHIRS